MVMLFICRCNPGTSARRREQAYKDQWKWQLVPDRLPFKGFSRGQGFTGMTLRPGGLKYQDATVMVSNTSEGTASTKAWP